MPASATGPHGALCLGVPSQASERLSPHGPPLLDYTPALLGFVIAFA